MQAGTYSIAELADAVNSWCKQHDVAPLHNRVGEFVTGRNIRYYQGIGLVARPVNSSGRGFTDLHRLQLIAIRLLQAKGWSLDRIQAALAGRTEAELRQIEENGVQHLQYSPAASTRASAGDWVVVPLSDDLLLLSRGRLDLTPAQRQRVLDLLSPPPAVPWAPDEGAFRPEID
jgi:DNA-binding transcriptional MerR regulator